MASPIILDGKKYHYYDHDGDAINIAPPILNQWYTVFEADDVRLLWCRIMQYNTDVAAKDVEIRWTIDGKVYFGSESLPSAVDYFVYRNRGASVGGTSGLTITVTMVNAAYYIDKRGHRFKVEVRITSALGTAQDLRCSCVRETLEET